MNKSDKNQAGHLQKMIMPHLTFLDKISQNCIFQKLFSTNPDLTEVLDHFIPSIVKEYSPIKQFILVACLNSLKNKHWSFMEEQKNIAEFYPISTKSIWSKKFVYTVWYVWKWRCQKMSGRKDHWTLLDLQVQ